MTVRDKEVDRKRKEKQQDLTLTLTLTPVPAECEHEALLRRVSWYGMAWGGVKMVGLSVRLRRFVASWLG
jgi:hypothetical protein